MYSGCRLCLLVCLASVVSDVGLKAAMSAGMAPMADDVK